MAVENTADFSGPYVANGATVAFPFTFISMSADEIAVLLRDADGDDSIVSSALYTVTRADGGTGTVTFDTAPASGNSVFIYSDVSFEQSIDFEDGSGWKASPVNEVSDRGAARDIVLKGKVDRALVGPVGETMAELPSAIARAGKYVAFDAGGDPVPSEGTGNDTALRTDLAADPGSSLLGWLSDAIGGVKRALSDRLADTNSALDVMTSAQRADIRARTRALNVSVPLQKALDHGVLNMRGVTLPAGDYLASGLTIAADGVHLIGKGRVRIYKAANGPILTVTGADVKVSGIEFIDASGTFTGDNVVWSGNRGMWENSGSQGAAGRAVKATGQSFNIVSVLNILQTRDATGTGYDLEIGVSGTPTLYHHINDIYTSQSTGGILMTEVGTASIIGGQFGKLTILPGAGGAGNHGPYVNNCRINGAIRIEQSNTKFGENSVSANVSVGDGVATISGVSIGPGFAMQSGTTFTVNANVIESSFFVGQLLSQTVTVNINATSQLNNDIYHGPITFTPALSAAGGGASLGNGTLTGNYSREGRRATVTWAFSYGASTSFGTGLVRLSTPLAMNGAIAQPAQGTGTYLDAGTIFGHLVPRITFGTSYVELLPDQAGNFVTANVPHVWAVSDTINCQISYPVGAP